MKFDKVPENTFRMESLAFSPVFINILIFTVQKIAAYVLVPCAKFKTTWVLKKGVNYTLSLHTAAGTNVASLFGEY